MAYAQITLAISDQCEGGMEGFAPLSDRLPVQVFADAMEDGQHGGTHAFFLDLMDHTGQADEKCISQEQAARILGTPTETLIPLGRQRLAQINDEAAEYFAARAATGA